MFIVRGFNISQFILFAYLKKHIISGVFFCLKTSLIVFENKTNVQINVNLWIPLLLSTLLLLVNSVTSCQLRNYCFFMSYFVGILKNVFVLFPKHSLTCCLQIIIQMKKLTHLTNNLWVILWHENIHILHMRRHFLTNIM